VPKIDWRDDDQPRVERFGKPQRRRLPFSSRARAISGWDVGAGAPAVSVEPPLPATRRPLHLIWGQPVRRTP
jgi:hypothetical protein